MAFKDLFKKRYTTQVWCNNCQTYQEIQIPKGISIIQFIEGNTGKCNQCGCCTLIPKQVNNFREQPKLKPKVKWLIKKQIEQPIQKIPRPSNRPANLLPKPRQQPGAERVERAKRAKQVKRVKQPNYAEPFFDSAERADHAKLVEPDFTPKGVFGKAKDIDFWTGLKREGEDENQ